MEAEERPASELWMARAAVYELLSLAFLPISGETAEHVEAGDYADAMGDALGAVAPSFDGALSFAVPSGDEAPGVLSALRREQTRLFFGEGRPPITPYIGVFFAQRQGRKGMLFVGSTTVEIEHFMRKCGVAKNLDGGQSNDPIDHIGSVCEFLEYLCLVRAGALTAPERFEVPADAYDQFVDEYFRPYALWCAERLDEESDLPFYRAVAEALRLVVG